MGRWMNIRLHGPFLLRKHALRANISFSAKDASHLLSSGTTTQYHSLRLDFRSFDKIAKRATEESKGLTLNGSSYIIAAIDRVVHHSVILDLMQVRSFRVQQATGQQTPTTDAQS